jgi:hypothetical protein
MPGMDPKLMALMASKGGPKPPGAPPGMPPGGDPPGGPPGAGVAGSPMSNPQPGAGEKQGSMLKVQQAMDLLEQSLPGLGSESEEGAAVLAALATISKKFGGEKRARSNELMPAELMNLIASLPKGPGGMKPPMPGGGAPPMPGGAPGGAPPGMPPGMPPMQ